jgi:hypothetical protein
VPDQPSARAPGVRRFDRQIVLDRSAPGRTQPIKKASAEMRRLFLLVGRWSSPFGGRMILAEYPARPSYKKRAQARAKLRHHQSPRGTHAGLPLSMRVSSIIPLLIARTLAREGDAAVGCVCFFLLGKSPAHMSADPEESGAAESAARIAARRRRR